MFSVKVMCEGRKLEKVLWALDGLVLGNPEITPVRGAIAKRGQVQAAQPLPGASLADNVGTYILSGGYTQVNAGVMRKAVVECGGKAGSYHYVIRQLQQSKLLGKIGKSRQYPVKDV